MEISFHIPNSNTQFVGDENRPPSQVGVVSSKLGSNYTPLLTSLLLYGRFSVTKLCQWLMLEQEVKNLLLHLKGLRFLLQGKCCGFRLHLSFFLGR